MSKMRRGITVEPELFAGELCMVKNYRVRARESWEPGTVMTVNASIDSNRKVRMSYDILLDRKTEKGRGIWLYVDGNSIKERK